MNLSAVLSAEGSNLSEQTCLLYCCLNYTNLSAALFLVLIKPVYSVVSWTEETSLHTVLWTEQTCQQYCVLNWWSLYVVLFLELIKLYSSTISWIDLMSALNWLNLFTALCHEQINPVCKFYILNWLNLFTTVSWTLYITSTTPHALKRKIVRSWHWTMSVMMDKTKQQKVLFGKFWIKCMFTGEVLSVYFVSDKTEWILMISRNCCLN
jgi:hypothetical protein